MRKRPDYRRELVQAAEDAAARILTEERTGVTYPYVKTVALLRKAWLEGHAAAKKEKDK